MNFWEHLEGRPASGHPPWEEYVPTTSERSAWYRFDEPPMLDDGRLDPLAVVTMCDTMPGAVSERMGRRDQMYLPPSCDLTVHLLDDAHTEWVLAVNRARYAGDGYASTEMEIWDASLRAPRCVRDPADVLRLPRRPAPTRGTRAPLGLRVPFASRGDVRRRRHRSMATWWDEREALVNGAIAIVSGQSRCTRAEAIALLRRRAEATNTDLEAAAHAVIEMGTRLGYRDLGPSFVGAADAQPVETVAVT